ncbi:hypothetical protein F5B19DRAFT_474316 [Rostrohypoxylon terebratum]|nr:hypothetical protein F5B19DRAFT_474316 [Rostrohypoxylon terebratum]
MTNPKLIGVLLSAVLAYLRSYFDVGLGSSGLLYPLRAAVHLVEFWSRGLAEPRNSGGIIIGGVVNDVVPSYWKPRETKENDTIYFRCIKLILTRSATYPSSVTYA